MRHTFFALLASFLVSCSHHSIEKVNYEKYSAHITSREISSDFADVGKVSTSKSDFVFKDCREIAESALADLIKKARKMGGNALTNVQWKTHPELKTLTPTCEVRWGWFAAYVVGGLGPWVKNVEVSATVARKPDDLKILPKNAHLLEEHSSDIESARLILATSN